MTINTRELIEAVSIVTENHNVRVTVKGSLKASAIVAGTTFFGGMLMGPPGIIVGATAGAFYSYSRARGTFKSAALVIRDDLSNEQKEQLCRHVVNAFENFSAQDVAVLIPLLMADMSFQTIVMKHVVEFLTQEMRMQVID